MTRRSTRREFLATTAATGAGLWLGSCASHATRQDSPNGRLDLGVIGVGDRGRANLDAVASQNVVALCDVDEGFLAAAAERFPMAARYRDFRRMLEREKLDAVVVSTPDHTHAVAAKAALDSGLSVYCEKPLTHSVHEARIITEAAARAGVVTQMGTQIHAGSNYRRVVELVRAGVIGEVEEVHVFINKTWSASALPEGEHPVPEHLDYDLWTGPARKLPFHTEYHPARWRRYWNFGGGTLADMGCHYLDLPFWALELRYPVSVEAEGPPPHPDATPHWMHVTWRFPARGELSPVDLHWYDGGRRPELLEEMGVDWRNGALFLGSKGSLLADYDRHVLLPAEDFAGFEPPAPSIPESIGHHREWIEACKGNGRTTCDFAYSGPLTEAVLLGAVAYRTGVKLAWDAVAMETGVEAADALLRREYRAGWKL
ncbi:MAG: Gfo/Idh/MocA family oxidoreductase [Planctomycetota bacterium]|nr:Gfo/Idh/MocA family oxidoreductase [Planctomycetota bacterium]